MTKKKAKEEKAPFVAPARLKVGIPAGTRELCTFLILGGSPIMQHSPRGMMADDAVALAEEAERRKHPDRIISKKDKILRLAEETAELGSYPTNDGRFYHPASAFVASLLDGLWAAKAEYPGTTELASNVLAKSIRVTHNQAILVDPKTFKPFKWGKKRDIFHPPYFIDSRTVVNCTTGGRIVSHRPLWVRWATFIVLSYDVTQAQRTVVLQGLERGGESVGVGAFRPLPPRNRPSNKKGKGGPYGVYIPCIWDKVIPKGARWEV